MNPCREQTYFIFENFIFLATTSLTIYCPDGIPLAKKKKKFAYHTNLKSAS